MHLGLPMLSKPCSILFMSLLISGVASAQEGRFTLVPEGGVVPFQSTCFDDLATAKLLTWKEFQEREFKIKMQYELELLSEQNDFKLKELQIEFEEAQFRFDETLKIKDREILELKNIIKKDKNINLPLAIAASVLGGVAVGIGAAYAINQVAN